MYRKIQYCQILIVLILSACSTSGAIDDGPRESAPDLNYRGSDCILIPTIRDYTPLDNQHLLIRGSGRRAYFVTLFGPAFDMRGAIGLRVDSRDDQLCPYGGDAIVFGSFAGERVNVASISRVTAEQEEQLLFRYGRKEPVEPAAPAKPVDIAGAEVEELG